MPTPHQNETEDDFVNRCIPIVMKEGIVKDNEQAAVICHSKFKQNKKLADCYDSAEDCIQDQIRMGKPKEVAEVIADYFSRKIKIILRLECK